MRTDRGRVLSVASPFHSVWEPNNSFLGFVKVTGAAVAVLASVAERLAAIDWPAPPPRDGPALLAVWLLPSRGHPHQSFFGELFWGRVGGAGDGGPGPRGRASYG